MKAERHSYHGGCEEGQNMRCLMAINMQSSVFMEKKERLSNFRLGRNYKTAGLQRNKINIS
jgi:hypothetical protein